MLFPSDFKDTVHDRIRCLFVLMVGEHGPLAAFAGAQGVVAQMVAEEVHREMGLA